MKLIYHKKFWKDFQIKSLCKIHIFRINKKNTRGVYTAIVSGQHVSGLDMYPQQLVSHPQKYGSFY